jgi:hypothetical protein
MVHVWSEQNRNYDVIVTAAVQAPSDGGHPST